MLGNIQISFESRYYVDHNIERASTNTWRHILSTLINNRFECPCYGRLDRTSLQPIVGENDCIRKLCMKNHCEDIHMSSAAEALAAYYYEDPGSKYDDVKIEHERFHDLTDQVDRAKGTSAHIN